MKHFAVGKYEAHPEKRVHEARPVWRKVMLRLLSFGKRQSRGMEL